MSDEIRTTTVTIASGASLSSTATLGDGWKVLGFSPDSAWDTNSMTFQISFDETNYQNLYDENGEYTVSGAVASAYYATQPWKFWGVRKLKVRSGTASSAVNQTGNTVITVICERIT